MHEIIYVIRVQCNNLWLVADKSAFSQMHFAMVTTSHRENISVGLFLKRSENT